MGALTERRAGVDVFYTPRSVSTEQTSEDIFTTTAAEENKHPLREALIDLSLAVGAFIAATIQRNSF